jgi:hypothetical protein
MKKQMQRPIRSNDDILRELATVYQTHNYTRKCTDEDIRNRYNELRQRIQNKGLDLIDVGVMVYQATTNKFDGCQ